MPEQTEGLRGWEPPRWRAGCAAPTPARALARSASGNLTHLPLCVRAGSSECICTVRKSLYSHATYVGIFKYLKLNNILRK